MEQPFVNASLPKAAAGDAGRSGAGERTPPAEGGATERTSTSEGGATERTPTSERGATERTSTARGAADSVYWVTHWDDLLQASTHKNTHACRVQR